MTTIRSITNYLEKIAPLDGAEDFDNVGLLIGNYANKVDGILITLDTLEETVDQAIDKRGRVNPRRMIGWAAYCTACKEIEDLFEEHRKLNQIQSPIGWDFTPIEQRIAA